MARIGRYSVKIKEIFSLSDRKEKKFLLAPTHEEICTDLIKKICHSYKDLPLGISN